MCAGTASLIPLLLHCGLKHVTDIAAVVDANGSVLGREEAVLVVLPRNGTAGIAPDVG
jgi:hypothetical protein